MIRFLLYATGFLVLAFSGVLHGLWIDRWGASPDLQAAAARCAEVATSLGDWEGQAATVDARQLVVADVVGHLSRRYTNRITGQAVTVLLLCGRPGPLAVHTPEVCYRGSGYEMVGKEQKRRIEPDTSSAGEVWTARFRKPGVAPQPLRVFWAWSDGRAWTASANPRVAFARSGYLYKLYVNRALSSTDDLLDEDPCLEFFEVLLPELQRCLSPTS